MRRINPSSPAIYNKAPNPGLYSGVIDFQAIGIYYFMVDTEIATSAIFLAAVKLLQWSPRVKASFGSRMRLFQYFESISCLPSGECHINGGCRQIPTDFLIFFSGKIIATASPNKYSSHMQWKYPGAKGFLLPLRMYGALYFIFRKISSSATRFAIVCNKSLKHGLDMTLVGTLIATLFLLMSGQARALFMPAGSQGNH